MNIDSSELEDERLQKSVKCTRVRLVYRLAAAFVALLGFWCCVSSACMFYGTEHMLKFSIFSVSSLFFGGYMLWIAAMGTLPLGSQRDNSLHSK